MKKNILLHPFVFVFSSLVYLFSISAVIVSPDQVIRPLFGIWGLLLVLIFPAYWLTRDWNWAGILLSVIAVSFFSAPLFFQAVTANLVVIILCWLAYCYIKRLPVTPLHIVNILNLVSTLFLMIGIYKVAWQASGISLSDTPQYNWKNRVLPVELVPQRGKPDIYYIVLDAYGRTDVLNEYYNFDNSDFVESLQTRGFIIPSHARSNYTKTVMSISSTLNMNYVSNLAPKLEDKNTYYWWLTTPLIDHSNVREMLEKIGYRSYSITTGWGLTDNPTTDVYYQPYPLIINDFEYVLLSNTPSNFMSPFFSRNSYFPSFDAHRNLFLYNFETLSKISQESGPKFVFAHIVSPHPPFVFGEDGEYLTPDYSYSFYDANDIALTDEDYRIGYVNQARFLNKKIYSLVDEILKNSQTPPIIILQGDHGPGMLTDFRSSENTCLKERYSIFSAYYLPGIIPNAIPDDITPVNLFRIIFNEYFETDFSLLPRYHFFPKDTVLFRNEDVTSRVDTCLINK